MNINELESAEWVTIWAGNWSFLTCSHFGEQYTKTLRVEGARFVKHAVFIVHEAKSSAFLPLKEKEAFGRHIASVVRKSPDEKIRDLCKSFKKEADKILAFIKRYETADISLDIYTKFWQHVDDYYIPHITCKYVVDYLDKELLEKHLGALQEARVYAESVFKRTEDFMAGLARAIGKKTASTSENVLCMTKEEMIDYLADGRLPNKSLLEQRYNDAAFVFKDGDYSLFIGKDVLPIEEAVARPLESNELKGQTAYPGKARGIARVISDPEHAETFIKGDILVSGMTRPEFVPLMEKAAAIVTDAGGILCHAAIVARELGKPCVIGTKIATKVLKDGDIVEVDANKGIVRKLS